MRSTTFSLILSFTFGYMAHMRRKKPLRQKYSGFSLAPQFALPTA